MSDRSNASSDVPTCSTRLKNEYESPNKTKQNKKHKDQLACSTPDDRDQQITPQTDSSTKKIKKKLKCELCDYETTSINYLTRHLIKHEGNFDPSDNKIYECEHCDKRFKDMSTLDNHRNLHLGFKPFVCTVCDDTFGTKGELTRHTKYKHTLEKPHKCDECNYSTVELSKLRRHMRVHTDERPYLCGFCDYASRDTFKLKRHMRIHTGEKPYECPICKNCFTQSNTLKGHIKAYHKEVPIVLDESGSPVQETKPIDTNRRKYKLRKMKECGTAATSNQDKITNMSDTSLNTFYTGMSINEPKTFSIKREPKLSTFIITDSNDSSIKKIENDDMWFTCDQCFMRFLTKDLLQEHHAKHTGDRPFDCEICGIKFSHKFALKAHLLSHDINYNEKLKQSLTTGSQNAKSRFINRKLSDTSNSSNKDLAQFEANYYIEENNSNDKQDQDMSEHLYETNSSLNSSNLESSDMSKLEERRVTNESNDLNISSYPIESDSLESIVKQTLNDVVDLVCLNTEIKNPPCIDLTTNNAPSEAKTPRKIAPLEKSMVNFVNNQQPIIIRLMPSNSMVQSMKPSPIVLLGNSTQSSFIPGMPGFIIPLKTSPIVTQNQNRLILPVTLTQPTSLNTNTSNNNTNLPCTSSQALNKGSNNDGDDDEVVVLKTPDKSKQTTPVKPLSWNKVYKEHQMKKSIEASIEKTLLDLNKDNKSLEKEKTDNQLKSPTVQFRAGHRKRAIQAVENSFVIMGQDDKLKSPIKKLKSKSISIDSINQSNEEDKFVCKYCSKESENLSKLTRHVKSVHKHLLKTDVKSNDQFQTDDFLSHLNATFDILNPNSNQSESIESLSQNSNGIKPLNDSSLNVTNDDNEDDDDDDIYEISKSSPKCTLKKHNSDSNLVVKSIYDKSSSELHKTISTTLLVKTKKTKLTGSESNSQLKRTSHLASSSSTNLINQSDSMNSSKLDEFTTKSNSSTPKKVKKTPTKNLKSK